MTRASCIGLSFNTINCDSFQIEKSHEYFYQDVFILSSQRLTSRSLNLLAHDLNLKFLKGF